MLSYRCRIFIEQFHKNYTRIILYLEVIAGKYNKLYLCILLTSF